MYESIGERHKNVGEVRFPGNSEGIGDCLKYFRRSKDNSEQVQASSQIEDIYHNSCKSGNHHCKGLTNTFTLQGAW